MYLTLPWFIGLVFFCLAGFFWTVLDNRWLMGRTDDIDEAADRYRTATDKRLERIEDWVKHLDERTRHQAGARPPEPVWHRPLVIDAVTNTDDTGPGTVPMTVPGPTTEPINLPATQPQEAVLLAKLEESGHDQWLTDAMARIKAIAEGAA